MKAALTVAVLAGCCAAARAQDNTFLLLTSNAVSPEQPETFVEVWAKFDPVHYAFAGAAFSVFADMDPGMFTGAEELLNGPGTKDGTIGPGGDSVLDIISGQLHGFAKIYADTSNPILIWRGLWTTDDFTPRTIGLATETTVYFVYVDFMGNNENIIDQFFEGAGQIQVVPGPGVTVPLAFAALAAARRRRGRCGC